MKSSLAPPIAEQLLAFDDFDNRWRDELFPSAVPGLDPVQHIARIDGQKTRVEAWDISETSVIHQVGEEMAEVRGDGGILQRLDFAALAIERRIDIELC